jgi:nucleoside-diphosphate-sugar epimerase
MQCLVTGATGCIGLNLTKRLISEGYTVVALGRNPQIGAVLTQLGAQFIAKDLKEADWLKYLAVDMDVIFHCAALSSPWGRYQDFYEANVLGTQHVLDAVAEKTRLIHVSSPSIYFDFKEKFNIKEHDLLPKKPINHYVKTKLQAETLVDTAFMQRQLNVITIRPRAIFGPHDRAILPRLLKAEKNGVIPVVGSGTNLIDVTYVDNVVESLLLAAHADATCFGKKYNITNDEPHTLNAILSLLFNALQKKIQFKYIPLAVAKKIAQGLELIYSLPFIQQEPRLTAYSAGVLALGQTLNIDAAKKELGYKPIISIEQGMQHFAKWYASND